MICHCLTGFIDGHYFCQRQRRPKLSNTEENKEIQRASGILAGSTLFSRVLGLVRNQLLSHFFGTGMEADAFIAAFTIPNALRRLFGEGGLTPAFVSLLTRSLHEAEDKWRSFISSSFFWLSLCTLFLTALGIWFAPEIVRIYVPHFQDSPEKFERTVELTRVLFPFTVLICWAAFFMGILNCFKHFFLPAIGPAILNLTVIIVTPICLFFIFPDTPYGIFIFAGSILLGVCLQLAVQIPKLRKLNALPTFKFKAIDPRVLELGYLLLPAVFSMGIHQLNIIVNRVFASDINGAVSQLFYADLIVELPVSLVATSMSVAAMPSFARLFVANDQNNLAQSVKYSMGLNASLALPSTFGILALSTPIISTIFYTGQFTQEDVSVCSQALVFFALGMPFFCLIRSLLPLYFAAKDTRTPAIFGFVALLVNLLFAWKLSSVLGAAGIALATSIASAVNCSLLAALIFFRFRYFHWRQISLQFFKVFFISSVMGAVLFALLQILPDSLWLVKGFSVSKIVSLAGLVALGVLVYVYLARFFKIQEFNDLLRRSKS